MDRFNIPDEEFSAFLPFHPNMLDTNQIDDDAVFQGILDEINIYEASFPV